MSDPQQEFRSEVERARQAYRISLARFQEVVNDAPSGLPYPDGTTRVSQAGLEVRRALAQYMQAVKRQNEFAVNRAIDGGSDPAEDPE